MTKGNKMRVDLPAHGGQAGHALFDATSGNVTVVMDAQKMAMTVNPGVAAAAAAEAAKPPTITKTGNHELVAGRDCEDWDVAEPNGKHEALCVTRGIPFFDLGAAAPGGGPSFGSWFKDDHVFPLRATVSNNTGAIESRMQVTQIEAKPLDDALFAVPAGYRTMNMPAGGPRPGAPPH
jgi:hypothetical protein